MMSIIISIITFAMIFSLASVWLYRRLDILKDEWTKIELIALITFAIMLANCVTLIVLLAEILPLIYLDLIPPSDSLSMLCVCLIVQLGILIIYPLVEFIHFAQEGTQATESYHRALERVNDKLGDAFQRIRLPRQLAGACLYGFVFGGIMVLIFLASNFVTYPIPGFTQVWTVFLLYPVLILGYYAGRGTYNGIRDLLYLGQYNPLRHRSFGAWIALTGFLISLYGYIALYLNMSLIAFLTGVFDIWMEHLDLAWIESIVPIISLGVLVISITLSIYLILSGFREDYLGNTPLIRLFDYVFTGYLFGAVVNLLFLTILTSHPEEFGVIKDSLSNTVNWLHLDINNLLITLVTNIDEIAIVILVVFFIFNARIARRNAERTIYFEDFITENIGKQDETGKYTVNASEILEKLIANNKDLESINLAGCGIIELPDKIGKLKKLKILDLAFNSLSSLPESIGDLENLKKLYLKMNNLTSLPESLGNLTGLQILNLSGQIGYNFCSLPESFSNLKNLQILNLEFNSFESLPKSIGNLKNLEKLNIFNNRLISLPANLGKLKKLVELNLGDNKLTSLPTSLGDLVNLQKFDLNRNQLRKLPTSLFSPRNDQ